MKQLDQNAMNSNKILSKYSFYLFKTRTVIIENLNHIDQLKLKGVWFSLLLMCEQYFSQQFVLSSNIYSRCPGYPFRNIRYIKINDYSFPVSLESSFLLFPKAFDFFCSNNSNYEVNCRLPNDIDILFGMNSLLSLINDCTFIEILGEKGRTFLFLADLFENGFLKATSEHSFQTGFHIFQFHLYINFHIFIHNFHCLMILF